MSSSAQPAAKSSPVPESAQRLLWGFSLSPYRGLRLAACTLGKRWLPWLLRVEWWRGEFQTALSMMCAKVNDGILQSLICTISAVSS